MPGTLSTTVSAAMQLREDVNLTHFWLILAGVIPSNGKTKRLWLENGGKGTTVLEPRHSFFPQSAQESGHKRVFMDV